MGCPCVSCFSIVRLSNVVRNAVHVYRSRTHARKQASCASLAGHQKKLTPCPCWQGTRRSSKQLPKTWCLVGSGFTQPLTRRRSIWAVFVDSPVCVRLHRIYAIVVGG